LVTPEGRLWIAGTDVTHTDRSSLIAFVPQNIQQATVGELSVRENMVLAARRGQPALWTSWHQLDNSTLKEAHTSLFQVMQDSFPWEEGWLDRPMDSLSGGQRQMVAVAMACASHPQILLLDEHTAALDPRAARAVMQATMAQLRHHRTTTLMVTHQLDHALAWGDRLLMLHRGRWVLDVRGETKKALTIEKLLDIFHGFDDTTWHEAGLKEKPA
jgi:putative ABC transport system ATP-binding protein